MVKNGGKRYLKYPQKLHPTHSDNNIDINENTIQHIRLQKKTFNKTNQGKVEQAKEVSKNKIILLE